MSFRGADLKAINFHFLDLVVAEHIERVHLYSGIVAALPFAKGPQSSSKGEPDRLIRIQTYGALDIKCHSNDDSHKN